MTAAELDTVSTIWIFASNDENHLITYTGIEKRLSSVTAANAKQIVQTWRELFREGAQQRDILLRTLEAKLGLKDLVIPK